MFRRNIDEEEDEDQFSTNQRSSSSGSNDNEERIQMRHRVSLHQYRQYNNFNRYHEENMHANRSNDLMLEDSNDESSTQRDSRMDIDTMNADSEGAYSYEYLRPPNEYEIELVVDDFVEKIRSCEVTYSEWKDCPNFVYRLLFVAKSKIEKTPYPVTSAFIEAVRKPDWVHDWGFMDVQYYIILINTLDYRKSYYRFDHYNFSHMEADRGWHHFIPLEQFRMGGFVNEEGQIILRAGVYPIGSESFCNVRDKNYNSKLRTGYVGLVNHGATCYLNALLQLLFHINIFREAVCMTQFSLKDIYGKETLKFFNLQWKKIKQKKKAIRAKKLEQDLQRRLENGTENEEGEQNRKNELNQTDETYLKGIDKNKDMLVEMLEKSTQHKQKPQMKNVNKRELKTNEHSKKRIITLKMDHERPLAGDNAFSNLLKEGKGKMKNQKTSKDKIYKEGTKKEETEIDDIEEIEIEEENEDEEEENENTNENNLLCGSSSESCSRSDVSLISITSSGSSTFSNCSIENSKFYYQKKKKKLSGVEMETYCRNILSEEQGETGLPVPLALQNLFYRLYTEDDALSCTEVMHSFGWKPTDMFTQQDTHELLKLLLDKVEEQTKGTVVEGCIKRMFEGEVETYIECIDIDYKSVRKETYEDIQLDIQGCGNIYDSLDKAIEAEILEGDNIYETEGYGKQKAKKGMRFLSFPNICIFLLKRFTFDTHKFNPVKLNNRYEFYKEIDLSKYCENAGQYILHAVSVHQGSTNSGHYYSFSYKPSENIWLKCDDERIYRVSEYSAINDNFGGLDIDIDKDSYEFDLVDQIKQRVKNYNAYMLVYVKKSLLPQLIKECDPAVVNPQLAKRVKLQRVIGEQRQKLKDKLVEYVKIRVFDKYCYMNTSFVDIPLDGVTALFTIKFNHHTPLEVVLSKILRIIKKIYEKKKQRFRQKFLQRVNKISKELKLGNIPEEWNKLQITDFLKKGIQKYLNENSKTIQKNNMKGNRNNVRKSVNHKSESQGELNQNQPSNRKDDNTQLVEYGVEEQNKRIMKIQKLLKLIPKEKELGYESSSSCSSLSTVPSCCSNHSMEEQPIRSNLSLAKHLLRDSGVSTMLKLCKQDNNKNEVNGNPESKEKENGESEESNEEEMSEDDSYINNNEIQEISIAATSISESVSDRSSDSSSNGNSASASKIVSSSTSHVSTCENVIDSSKSPESTLVDNVTTEIMKNFYVLLNEHGNLYRFKPINIRKKSQDRLSLLLNKSREQSIDMFHNMDLLYVPPNPKRIEEKVMEKRRNILLFLKYFDVFAEDKVNDTSTICLDVISCCAYLKLKHLKHLMLEKVIEAMEKGYVTKYKYEQLKEYLNGTRRNNKIKHLTDFVIYLECRNDRIQLDPEKKIREFKYVTQGSVLVFSFPMSQYLKERIEYLYRIGRKPDDALTTEEIRQGYDIELNANVKEKILFKKWKLIRKMDGCVYLFNNKSGAYYRLHLKPNRSNEDSESVEIEEEEEEKGKNIISENTTSYIQPNVIQSNKDTKKPIRKTQKEFGLKNMIENPMDPILVTSSSDDDDDDDDDAIYDADFNIEDLESLERKNNNSDSGDNMNRQGGIRSGIHSKGNIKQTRQIRQQQQQPQSKIQIEGFDDYEESEMKKEGNKQEEEEKTEVKKIEEVINNFLDQDKVESIMRREKFNKKQQVGLYKFLKKWYEQNQDKSGELLYSLINKKEAIQIQQRYLELMKKEEKEEKEKEEKEQERNEKGEKEKTEEEKEISKKCKRNPVTSKKIHGFKRRRIGRDYQYPLYSPYSSDMTEEEKTKKRKKRKTKRREQKRKLFQIAKDSSNGKMSNEIETQEEKNEVEKEHFLNFMDYSKLRSINECASLGKEVDKNKRMINSSDIMNLRQETNQDNNVTYPTVTNITNQNIQNEMSVLDEMVEIVNSEVSYCSTAKSSLTYTSEDSLDSLIKEERSSEREYVEEIFDHKRRIEKRQMRKMKKQLKPRGGSNVNGNDLKIYQSGYIKHAENKEEKNEMIVLPECTTTSDNGDRTKDKSKKQKIVKKVGGCEHECEPILPSYLVSDYADYLEKKLHMRTFEFKIYDPIYQLGKYRNCAGISLNKNLKKNSCNYIERYHRFLKKELVKIELDVDMRMPAKQLFKHVCFKLNIDPTHVLIYPVPPLVSPFNFDPFNIDSLGKGRDIHRGLRDEEDEDDDDDDETERPYPVTVIEMVNNYSGHLEYEFSMEQKSFCISLLPWHYKFAQKFFPPNAPEYLTYVVQLFNNHAQSVAAFCGHINIRKEPHSSNKATAKEAGKVEVINLINGNNGSPDGVNNIERKIKSGGGIDIDDRSKFTTVQDLIDKIKLEMNPYLKKRGIDRNQKFRLSFVFGTKIKYYNSTDPLVSLDFYKTSQLRNPYKTPFRMEPDFSHEEKILMHRNELRLVQVINQTASKDMFGYSFDLLVGTNDTMAEIKKKIKEKSLLPKYIFDKISFCEYDNVKRIWRANDETIDWNNKRSLVFVAQHNLPSQAKQQMGIKIA